jgi:hypothetical protein
VSVFRPGSQTAVIGREPRQLCRGAQVARRSIEADSVRQSPVNTIRMISPDRSTSLAGPARQHRMHVTDRITTRHRPTSHRSGLRR